MNTFKGPIRLVMVMAAMGLVACGTANQKARVKVHYEQIANFQSYFTAPDSTGSGGAGPDGIFVMYRINKIENDGAEAKQFVFDKHKIVLITSSHTTNDEPAADNILLGSQLADDVSVNAGQVLGPSGGIGCIIKVARATDPKTLVGKMIDPIHQIDTAQPVSMARKPGNNSEATVIDALPGPLQNLCNTSWKP